MSQIARYLLLTGISGALAFAASVASAQTAKDVVCKGCVEAKDIGNGAVTTNKIPNKTITPAKLSAPAGAAGTGAKSRYGISATQVIHHITVNVPDSGVVVVQASGHFKFNSVGASVVCLLSKKISLSGPIIAASGSDDFSANRTPLSVTRTFTEKKGGKRTYRLICNPAPGADVDVLNAILSVVYTPTDIRVK